MSSGYVPSFRGAPLRREPGIQSGARGWIPGLRQEAHPGMTVEPRRIESGGRWPGLSRQQPVDQENDGTDGQSPGFGFSGFGGLFVEIDGPFPAARFDALDHNVVFAAVLHFQILKTNREKVAPRGSGWNRFFSEAPRTLGRTTRTDVILRSRALARRLEGRPLALVAHPSRLAVKNGEHLRMTAVFGAQRKKPGRFSGSGLPLGEFHDNPTRGHCHLFPKSV